MGVDAIGTSEHYVNDASKKMQMVNVTRSISSTSVNNVQKSALIGFKEETNQENTKDGSTEQKLKDAIAGANKKLAEKRTRCEFSYYEEVNRISIKVYDRETNEVIKEIPAEDALETLEKIWNLAGLLVDERC